ncbi:hypothetical protein FisN_19Hh219 [Fistulifera solaris]|uniref:SGNH hydrolase-type esterase domain-containing protein n=1 Tax=Fistulifera solaris TaxID=1519565 RepID=A0A1Z5K0T8_FISSO|nr:hypothetical protein FisN_19Hh219 [Fistulifera solaris]|eukprot:GAX19638.1 hypothetical protein FisN_19Hh219 [Fistulifera solaris]
MTKGAYESLPVREDEETLSTGPKGDRSSRSTLIYTLLSLFLFIVTGIIIYYLPDNNISDVVLEERKDSPTEESSVDKSEERSQAPTAFPAPITFVDPIYVGPTLPEVIRSCPSLQYYQELRQKLDNMDLCDDIGRERKCLCQNPTISRPQEDDYRYYKKWNKAFQRNVDMAQRYNSSQALDVLLLGDSLTEHWLGTDLGGPNSEFDGVPPVYRHYFQEGTLRGLALGIAGDRIPHLLYRMKVGELVTTAKVIWINIGTNDLGGDHCNVDAVVAGNIAVAEFVLNAVDSSRTKVVLNSLLPRSGRNASDTHLIKDRNWQEALRVNKHLECYSEMLASSALEFFDATRLFVAHHSPDYRNATLYQDPIHLSSEGYQIWGDAIVQRVKEIQLEMSGDENITSQPTCGEASYFDALVNEVSTAPTNRCRQKDSCLCLDPYLPMTNDDPRMHARWIKTFQRNKDQLIPFLANNATVELMLMGDSITELWLGTVLGSPSLRYRDIPDVFAELFSIESTLVMGIAADKSSYLLHRIQNGELPSELDVSVVWILIGTNDITDDCNPNTIVAANIIIVKEILSRQPKARIVINSILPRMDTGFDVIPLINAKLKCFAESTGTAVAFFEATNLFLNSDGTVKADLYADGVHPNKKGYEIWGRAIKEYRALILKK